MILELYLSLGKTIPHLKTFIFKRISIKRGSLKFYATSISNHYRKRSTVSVIKSKKNMLETSKPISYAKTRDRNQLSIELDSHRVESTSFVELLPDRETDRPN